MPCFPGSGRLNGKVALSTGGDCGIGRAVAVAMARESASIALPLGARLGGVPGACDPPPYTHPAGKPQVVPSWPPNMDASSRDQRTAWLSVPAPPESLTKIGRASCGGRVCTDG